MIRAVSSTSAAARLDAAYAFLTDRPAGSETVIVGASRGAADDVARVVARRSGATFGVTRCSLIELAARAARSAAPSESPNGGAARRTVGTQAGAEAIAARAVFEAVRAGDLAYFAPVAEMPGFPKALARTIHELRLAGLTPSSMDPGASAGAPVADIAALLARVEAQLESAGVDDRAAIFRLAAERCRAGAVRWATLPIVLLDVPLDSRAEEAFVAALIARSPAALATVPAGDTFAIAALARLGIAIEDLDGERSECR